MYSSFLPAILAKQARDQQQVAEFLIGKNALDKTSAIELSNEQKQKIGYFLAHKVVDKFNNRYYLNKEKYENFIKTDKVAAVVGIIVILGIVLVTIFYMVS